MKWSCTVSHGGKSWGRARHRQPSGKRYKHASNVRRLGYLSRALRESGRAKNDTILAYCASLKSLG